MMPFSVLAIFELLTSDGPASHTLASGTFSDSKEVKVDLKNNTIVLTFSVLKGYSGNTTSSDFLKTKPKEQFETIFHLS